MSGSQSDGNQYYGDEKIGATGETLATDNLVLDDDKDFVAYEPFAAKAASYIRPVNEGTTWATLCLPFEVSLANQNFRAFKLLSADEGTETVELEEIETNIAAGTPVIIKMKDGATELKFTEADKEIAKDVHKQIPGSSAKSASNKYGEHYSACEICSRNQNPAGVVYVTEQGNRYHNLESCSGLKRSVRLVKASSVSEMGACSRCG